MAKEELCIKLIEVRRISNSGDCCSFLRGCAEVESWACSTKLKKFGR